MAGLLDGFFSAQGAPNPAPEPAPPDPRQEISFPDMFRSFGGGLRHGSSALAGLPGDLRDVATTGATDLFSFLAGRLGMSPERIVQAQQDAAAFMQRQPGLFPRLPTRVGTRAVMADALGPEYQPQTQVGDLAYKLGQNLPILPFTKRPL
jgi:hypothetical protein